MWEDLISRRIYLAKNIADERIASSMGLYAEKRQDSKIIESIQYTQSLLTNLLIPPKFIELPVPEVENSVVKLREFSINYGKLTAIAVRRVLQALTVRLYYFRFV